MKKIQISFTKQSKNKIWIGIIIAVVTLIILTIALYIANSSFRTFLDRYILRKEVIENNVTSINIESIENPSIYAYNKYITILSKNVLTTYSNLGKKEYEQEILVSDPLYASNNRFLVIAQKQGQNIYLISEKNILWEAQIEGNIQKVDVNKNGYVSVIISGGSYKTVVVTYTPAGKELFKTYLSSTTAIDTSISNDNKYISIAEINTSGTLIQSNVKTISLEKAQNDPTNSIIYTYNAAPNVLITSIEYHDKDNLVILHDEGIDILQGQNRTQIISFNENNTAYASIKLGNYVAYSNKKSGLFNNTQILLKNTSTGKENVYTINSTIKDLKTDSNSIAINIGSEVHFINTNGWLIKRYISEREMKDIVIADKIAGIVYQNKVEIIDL